MHSVPSVQSKAQHTFARSPSANIPRSTFNRSHGYKTTFNEGYLIPVFVDEVLPGDTLKVNMTAFARLATPIYPIMDNIYLESFFFFVPNRLVWEHWEQFNGQQANPTDSTDYILPTVTASSGVATGDIADYMGVPIKIDSIVMQSLPLRAYQMIYNEWFRDENLQDSVYFPIDDGPDTYSDYVLLRRGKRHDYFTSCLPWPQKINDGTTVEIPLGTYAPVISNVANGGTGIPKFDSYPLGSFADLSLGQDGMSHSGINNYMYVTGSAVGSATNVQWNQGGNTGLVTDLATATAATINQLRQAFQLQKLYERDARGGTRYTEIIRSHFGVISPDMRLQRPEYLGGGCSMVNVNPVAQTAPPTSTDDTPQGNLAAFGTCTLHGHGFTKSFTEHGHVIGIISSRADLNYQQGLNRMWSRSIRWDFYWPALSHIGEQAVLNQEIYAQGNSYDTEVFGYQERYAEYRYKPGLITGLFRSTATTPLDSWHLAQDFGSLPALNSTFIVENAPVNRVIAVTSQPHFIFDSFFDVQSARPIPVFGVPGLIDHF